MFLFLSHHHLLLLLLVDLKRLFFLLLLSNQSVFRLRLSFLLLFNLCYSLGLLLLDVVVDIHDHKLDVVLAAPSLGALLITCIGIDAMELVLR